MCVITEKGNHGQSLMLMLVGKLNLARFACLPTHRNVPPGDRWRERERNGSAELGKHQCCCQPTSRLRNSWDATEARESLSLQRQNTVGQIDRATRKESKQNNWLQLLKNGGNANVGQLTVKWASARLRESALCKCEVCTYWSTSQCRHRQRWQRDGVALHCVDDHGRFARHGWCRWGSACRDWLRRKTDQSRSKGTVDMVVARFVEKEKVN